MTFRRLAPIALAVSALFALLDGRAFAQAPLTLQAEADTWVRFDGDFRASSNWGCEWAMGVGTGYEGPTKPWGAADATRALVRFNLSAMPAGAVIKTATLKLTIGEFANGAPASTYVVDVHRVLDSGVRTPWVEGNGAYGVYPPPPGQPSNWPPGCTGVDPALGVVWLGWPDNIAWPPYTKISQPFFDPAPIASATVVQGDMYGTPLPFGNHKGDVISFDITALVSQWASGAAANHGVLLRDLTTDGNFRDLMFGAREGRKYPAYYPQAVDGPRLVITFVDTTPPEITCAAADTNWHPDNVSLACTAEDSGSGLLNESDANFLLATEVALGAETANAFTVTHEVCDKDGNCATAGPIGGNKVDRKGPVISIAVPWASSYTVGQAVAASYSCVDGGSGVASCTGPVASGAPIDTASPGTFAFAVSATDNVGHSSSLSTTYTVGYNVCLLYDPSKPKKSGSTIPIKLQLCDAAGRNLSGPAIVVTATGVGLVSGGVTGPAEDSGHANPDGNFRFDASLGGYIFNLKTTGLPSGTYRLVFTAGNDPSSHDALFQIR